METEVPGRIHLNFGGHVPSAEDFEACLKAVRDGDYVSVDAVEVALAEDPRQSGISERERQLLLRLTSLEAL